MHVAVKCSFLLIIYCKLKIKIKLENNQLCADCLPCISFLCDISVGLQADNSRYHCTKIITFSLSRLGVFSPRVRHLRINVTSGCKFHCGEQQKVKIF